MFQRAVLRDRQHSILFVLVWGLIPAVAISAPAASRSNVTIDRSVTIVESAEEPGPVRRATDDLLRDFGKVLGETPSLANHMEGSGQVAILISGPQRPYAGIKCVEPTGGAESFAFSIVHLAGRGQVRDVICLAGADMRGTIYAIYQFSQKVLGVDPMYLWTDKEPEKHSSITLQADFAKTYPKPVFRYRGFFPNDEDLLTGWIPAAKGEHTGISLKVWDNIFETTLRLKGNMIVPGTWIFPDDAQVEAAAKRGLIVNQHHAIPLGVNVARWPKDVPYNFSTHPEILERAWTNAVATYKPDEEILWSVGLRGLSDSSYASLDPSVRDNDPLLGKRISDAIAEQMKIVRAKYPKAEFVTDLWQEGARLMQKGLIQIPPEVTLVWADTGYGDMQDGGKVALGQGAYFHVAMMNGNANQLSEMVPVAVIQEEMGRYIKAGATSYILVNTSDIRPVAMTTRALMDVAWGGVPAQGADAKGSDADGAFYRSWAAEEFGAKSADAVAGVYKEYFAAPSLRSSFPSPGLTSAGNAPPAPPRLSNVPREEGDQHYHSEMRLLLLDRLSEHQVAVVPSQSPKWTAPRLMPEMSAEQRAALLERDIRECEEAQPRWDAVWQHAVAAKELVDPDRRDYYLAAVLTMIAINRESNRALLLVAQALQDDAAGDAEKARNEVGEALQALDAMQASMAAAEYGKWKNWYRGDWLTGVYRTRELVQAYADHLKDPMAKLPAPVSWSGWEAYFHIMEYEGDRSVDVH
ncbi:MAG TPA: glycosyl hydrolase 115 family protein [Terracidiphilus sp.]|nr:glycosyl hydrolase 115 family protein [Terracidiphilus sp.]